MTAELHVAEKERSPRDRLSRLEVAQRIAHGSSDGQTTYLEEVCIGAADQDQGSDRAPGYGTVDDRCVILDSGAAGDSGPGQYRGKRANVDSRRQAGGSTASAVGNPRTARRTRGLRSARVSVMPSVHEAHHVRIAIDGWVCLIPEDGMETVQDGSGD